MYVIYIIRAVCRRDDGKEDGAYSIYLFRCEKEIEMVYLRE